MQGVFENVVRTTRGRLARYDREGKRDGERPGGVEEGRGGGRERRKEERKRERQNSGLKSDRSILYLDNLAPYRR